MIDQGVRIAPFFLTGESGPLFCFHLAPARTQVRGQILYLHPFAEEMHKSRRMVAIQAADGYSVLQLDLSGCGDSWGDFSDARWERWRNDAIAGMRWLRGQSDRLPLLLWGLRLGATLAIDLATRLPDVHALLLWQPVTSGALFLKQFLRIKLASEMLTEGGRGKAFGNCWNNCARAKPSRSAVICWPPNWLALLRNCALRIWCRPVNPLGSRSVPRRRVASVRRVSRCWMPGSSKVAECIQAESWVSHFG